MNMKLDTQGRWPAAFTTLVLLAACGGGGDNGSATSSGYPGGPVACSTDGQRSWLRDYMNDRYLWFDKQGAPNEAATSMAQYLDALLFKPTDRHSNVQNTAIYNRLTQEGRRIGYGYSLLTNANGQFVVSYVEPNGPVSAAGLRRGDVIVTIDGLNAAQINAGQLPAVSTEGVQRDFVVQDPAGVQRSFSVLSQDFALQPVLDARVIPMPNGTKVGYLHYTSFIDNSEQAVADAITLLRTGGATEIVLDLRYNLGGSVVSAGKLATLVGGANLSGQVFTRYEFNSKYPSLNFQQNFYSRASLLSDPLANPPRVFIITSGQTASASEMVINGLRPYRTVVTVGDKTLGKPFGFQPRAACELTYSIVNFQLANSLGDSNYADGLPATCAVADDFSKPLGDPQEKRLAAVLNYISTGQCETPVASASSSAASDVSPASSKSRTGPAPIYWDEAPVLPGAILR